MTAKSGYATTLSGRPDSTREAVPKYQLDHNHSDNQGNDRE
jgi:hypothetical protein